MNPSPEPWVWIAAFLTLCIFSFLFRDNIFYSFAEHLFVGISAGYLIAITWHNQIYPNLVMPLFMQGNLVYIIPFALGLCYSTRFIPKIGYLVRLPIAFLLGWGSGVGIPERYPKTNTGYITDKRSFLKMGHRSMGDHYPYRSTLSTHLFLLF